MYLAMQWLMSWSKPEFPNLSGGEGMVPHKQWASARAHTKLHLHDLWARAPAAHTNGVHILTCCSCKWGCLHARHFCSRFQMVQGPIAPVKHGGGGGKSTGTQKKWEEPNYREPNLSSEVAPQEK